MFIDAQLRGKQQLLIVELFQLGCQPFILGAFFLEISNGFEICSLLVNQLNQTETSQKKVTVQQTTINNEKENHIWVI